METNATVIIAGVVLILLGILTNSIYHPFANGSFWIGVLLLVVGIIVFVVRHIDSNDD